MLFACFKKRKETAVKVELIQNSQQLFPSEYIKELKLLSLRDVALLKLISLSNRKAKKDAYDLDFITDIIPLNELIKLLREKQDTFADEKYRCLFDLDMETNPVKDPTVLLLFDNTNYNTATLRPSHSHDRIFIVEGSKNWLSVKASWRKKVTAILQ